MRRHHQAAITSRRRRWLMFALRVVGLYLPLFALVSFFCLRRLEWNNTFAPARYAPGPAWALPSGVEDVWFANAEGTRLHGWFARAHASPAAATVIFCHGSGGNVTEAKGVVQHLAARGCDVLAFDYRGYGRSEGEIKDERGLYADTDAAYDYLVRERGARPERITLYGLSLGTTAAVDVASRRPCAALIIESGLSSSEEMAAVVLPWLPRWLYWLGKNRLASARKLPQVHCPVLILHGTADPLVPIAQGRALYAAARVPKDLIIIPGGEHDLVDEGGADYLNCLADFIIKATPPAP